MAENNLTALTINSILIGLLCMGLLSAFILMANNEGQGAIFDDYPEIEALNLNFTNEYTGGQLVNVANINSNLSAAYNPEASISSADRSGNAININLQNLITITWNLIGILGGLLFGNVYRGVISGVVIALMGFLAVQYFIKNIRTGN